MRVRAKIVECEVKSMDGRGEDGRDVREGGGDGGEEGDAVVDGGGDVFGECVDLFSRRRMSAQGVKREQREREGGEIAERALS